MKTLATLTAALLLASGLGLSPASAEPGGCLKYGAAGAVGGHLAHHGVLGAAAGCATGMYVRHKHRKAVRAQQSAQTSASQDPSNTTTSQ